MIKRISCTVFLLFSLLSSAKESKQTNNKASKDPLNLLLDETNLNRTKVESYAPIVKKIAPAVVNVFTTKTITHNMRNPFDDPFFRDFFGDRFKKRLPQRSRKQQSLGSGVVVSANGYILTNNHVVQGADEILVSFGDKTKKKYKAKLIGRDPKSDIAVLKIDVKKIPFAVIANSDHVEVGDVVFAIGNPLGLGKTVTKGIISAKGRSIGLVDYEDFLQTDASINPGNSGGALVDIKGRLIGINTAIASRTGGSQGLGFAIPINQGRRIMEALINTGVVSRGFLGIRMQAVTPALKEHFGLKNLNGVLITDVEAKSAAEKAGMKEGDIILKLNKKSITGMKDIRLKISRSAPGTKVNFSILRDGKEKVFTCTLGTLKAPQKRGPVSLKNKNDGLFKGVTLSKITALHRQEFSIPKLIKGLVILSVDPNSQAAENGLKSGLVILKVNGKTVSNAVDISKVLKMNKKKSILLYLWSKEGKKFVTLKPKKAK
ncbi:MAG: Do family serine endopeptidase [Lentisphaeria bacterium]|nr:Do family serine endopeptidase [Lentisphaeria bacterium]